MDQLFVKRFIIYQCIWKERIMNLIFFFETKTEFKQQNNYDFLLDLSENQNEAHFQYFLLQQQNPKAANHKIKKTESDPENKAIRQNKKIERLSQEQTTQSSQKFHNFQKHLALTLKKNIHTENFYGENEQMIQIMKALWLCFIKLKNPSKKVIGLVLGIAKKIKKADWVKYGFDCLLNQYPETKIKESQKYLQLSIYTQIKKLDLDAVLKKRRIQRKGAFRIYFKEFEKVIGGEKPCEDFGIFRSNSLKRKDQHSQS